MKWLAILSAWVLAAAAVSHSGAGSAAAPSAAGAGLCANATQMQGFKTCADVEKAKQEGEVVIYSPDVEQGTAKLLQAFHDLFPQIKTNYVRLQTGALYAKIRAERQARTYVADVINLSDLGLVLDFEKKDGYARYMSPEMVNYKVEYKSQPEGYWTWGSIILAGIAYNPKIVAPEEAPKTWNDLLDPKWSGSVSVKTSNSGLQHITWYLLNEQLGGDYWKRFSQQKPHAFDSYVQQFDRLVNGQDKVAEAAQYSGYLEFKQKGAPLEFIRPAAGLPASPEVWGVVNNAPHPEAAKLFLDWFLSPLGQKAIANALFMNSPRTDVAPPPGGVGTGEMKLLFPKDWPAFLSSRPDFNRAWDTMTGLR
jgi:iron(III) transport system substrate-binding protein